MISPETKGPQSRQPQKARSIALTGSERLRLGRDLCGDLAACEAREWLVTNGIGGFASGTVGGFLSRRYHGLLVAALKPPLGRTLLVTKLDETAAYDGEIYPLFANRWASGGVDPAGFRHLESFRLEGTTPVWTYACADALLEKWVWMEQGANTTYVCYRLLRAGRPLELELRALVNHRDYHGSTRGGEWRMEIAALEGGLRVQAFEGAAPFYLRSAAAAVEAAHDWYRGFSLAAERYRGLESEEDHLHAGTFRVNLRPGEEVTVVASTEARADLDGAAALARRRARETAVREQWSAASPPALPATPDWVRQLALAADQFIVRRPLRDDPEALSVIAGYHWFGDWGRDTMISLPGLTLATGRPEVAAKILRTFARFVDRGMLPNVFPDAGETPEYNTVDATLWYFEAIRQYHAATGDDGLVRELFDVLDGIVDWHLQGTRYNIRHDPADGLLYAGEAGVQLTWMDAKVGEWVVTPRIGKPVEVNALWLNALATMARLAAIAGRPKAGYEQLARGVRSGFKRFWNEAAGFCFDVLDGPDGDDASLRPNQIFAVSLPESPLSSSQRRAVVDVCARHLLTSRGLRSLAPAHPDYQGRYGGDPRQRDGAYHQGTVWGWLLGPFVLAHLRAYGDAAPAASFLEPMADHLQSHGLGTASEIFDGDPPFVPRGCIAQAWTVAELLRAWRAIEATKADSGGRRLRTVSKARSRSAGPSTGATASEFTRQGERS